MLRMMFPGNISFKVKQCPGTLYYVKLTRPTLPSK